MEIVIRMFFNDHNPPHFHAATRMTKTLLILKIKNREGYLPNRAKSLTIVWAMNNGVNC